MTDDVSAPLQCTCPIERWSARFGDHASDCPSYGESVRPRWDGNSCEAWERGIPDPIALRSRQLLSDIKSLLARSEQDRNFGPAACRSACMARIARELMAASPTEPARLSGEPK